MMKVFSILKNEEGSALIVALLVLVILTLVGIGANNTTSTDIQIARNEKFHKIAFYAADGGTEAGIELVEQGIDERDWTDNSGHGNCYVTNGDFFLNPDLAINEVPSDANRDIYTPSGYAAGDPHTNLKIGSNTTLSTGGAVQMISGYGGTGFGSAGGGAWVTYDIRSQHQGLDNSESVVNMIWRHLL